jgi:hypothetical protein
MSATIELSERLRGTDLADRVREYEPILRQEIGDFAAVDWDVTDDRGRLRFVLRMRPKDDGGLTGEAKAFFDAEEILWRERMARRLKEIKGDLVRLEEWRRSLETFYQTVREWCQSLAPTWAIERHPTTVTEVPPGEYRVTALRIIEGASAVEVRPIGHQVVGADGRVDLEGEENRQILLLSHREGGWLWVDERTVVRLRPLTAELFIDLVRDCMG